MLQLNLLMRTSLLIWLAYLLPLLAWFIQLTASFMLSTYACFSGQLLLLHGISVGAAVLSLFGVGAGWRAWRLSCREHVKDTEGRCLLAFMALLLSVLIFMIVVVGELSNFFLVPCR